MYCAYCGAKMAETDDSCPVCGKWKKQVELAGGGPTVREPLPEEKTRVFSRDSASRAAGSRARQAERNAADRQSRPAQTPRTSSRYNPDADWLELSGQNTYPREFESAGWEAQNVRRTNQANTYRADDNWQDLNGERYLPSQSGQTYRPRRQADGYAQRQPAQGYRQQPAQSYEQQRQSRNYEQPRRSQYDRPAPQGKRAYRQGGQSSRPSAGRQGGSASGSYQNRGTGRQYASRGGQPARRPSGARPATHKNTAAVGFIAGLQRPHSKERKLLAVGGVAAAIFLLIIILISNLLSGVGDRGVMKKLASAYRSQDTEEVVALSSDLMKALYPGDQLNQNCRENLGAAKDYFSSHLGSSYSISYKAKFDVSFTGDDLQKELESTFDTFGESYDLSRVKEMKRGTLTLKAKKRGRKVERRISVVLVKEDGKWKLASQSLQ